MLLIVAQDAAETAAPGMSQELIAFVISVCQTFMKNVPISLGLAAVFTILTCSGPAIPASHGGASAISRPIFATGSSFRW